MCTHIEQLGLCVIPNNIVGKCPRSEKCCGRCQLRRSRGGEHRRWCRKIKSLWLRVSWRVADLRALCSGTCFTRTFSPPARWWDMRTFVPPKTNDFLNRHFRLSASPPPLVNNSVSPLLPLLRGAPFVPLIRRLRRTCAGTCERELRPSPRFFSFLAPSVSEDPPQEGQVAGCGLTSHS